MSSPPNLDIFSDIFYSSSDTSRPSSPLSPPTSSRPLFPPPSPPSTTSPPSSPTSTTLPPHSPPSTFTHLINNPDTKRLHSTHHTAGYRDGISSAKTSFLQRGFDEGYALGAELGVRVGYILGILEGLRGGCGSIAAAAASNTTTSSPSTATVAVGEKEGESKPKKVLEEARRELVVERVFAREWWGEDGIWRFEVGEGGREAAGGEEGVTFAKVAEEHPLLKSWLKRVRAEMGRLGVGEGRFEGEEWERGRVGGEMA